MLAGRLARVGQPVGGSLGVIVMISLAVRADALLAFFFLVGVVVGVIVVIAVLGAESR